MVFHILKPNKIVDNNKREFSNRQTGETKLEEWKDTYSLLYKYMEKLSDELISEANNYLKQNNIEDTDEIKEFIKIQILDFVEFAKQH